MSTASVPSEPSRVSGYTNGMKTAISVPNRVFQHGERLAKRLELSRSELYSRALAEYLERHVESSSRASGDLAR